jgi:molecular chaperone DnaK
VLVGEEQVAGTPLPPDATTLVRLAVPLGEEAEQAMSLVVTDTDGGSLAELPFALYRGDVRPRASALSRPAVVAKDLSIEVVRAGRRDRRVLLPKGTGLPMKVSQTFFTADQSGAVVLRLLQGRMPVKTLVLQVPSEIPVGTAVELDIRCDEAMRLEARANVAGHELWATVEPPAAPKFDPQGDVEGLLEDAETVRRNLWGIRGEAYRREADTLSAGIREVVSTDPDKLAVLCARLRRLVEEFKPDDAAGGLAPPLHHFEWELDGLRRVVFRAQAALMGMDREAWEARIRDIEARAKAAYDEVDAVAWRRIYNEVQALRETAHQEEFATLRIDDPAYLTKRLANAVHRINDVEKDLRDFVPSAADEVKDLQLAERDRLLTILDSKVGQELEGLEISETSDANVVRRKLEKISAELDRIDVALERIPSLGVVTEHGGGV